MPAKRRRTLASSLSRAAVSHSTRLLSTSAWAGPAASYATNSVDHLSLPTTVTLLPGSAFANISLRPLANTNLLKPVVAMLKVLPGTGYTVGTASNASVTISPSQTPKGTGLTGQYYTNSNATYSSNAKFQRGQSQAHQARHNVDFTWGTTSTPIREQQWLLLRPLDRDRFSHSIPKHIGLSPTRMTA